MNDKQCRLCLTTDNLDTLFKDLDRSQECSRVLKETTGLKITLNDGLPQYICTECIELVNMALSLRNRSQTSEKKLKQAGYKILVTAPNFSESEISDYEITNLNWPVIKHEDNAKTDFKLKHEDSNLKSNENEFCKGIKKKLKLKEKLKKKPKVEPDQPVSERALSELKNEKASAGGKQPETSKMAKRALYMELVDGVFDPKGPVKCKVCKKTVSKWACFVSHAKLHLGFKFVCESPAFRRHASDAGQLALSLSMTAECEPLKQEPEWGECGVSEAAEAEGLYAGHEVKDEVVLGPELIQMQDIAFSMPNVLTIKEENPHKPRLAGGADVWPECTHTCPGAGPCCNRSTEQQYGLRRCFVRLERLSMVDLQLNNPFYKNTSHIQIHRGEKPYGCNVCNKWFTRKCHLTAHVQIHTGQKPYCCDVCNKRFTSKSYLKSHIRIHAGEKPYCCDVCNKRFTYKSHLNTHIGIHTGKKPYCCDVCNKRFTTKSYLKSHIRIHTGEKPYCCGVCNKRFSNKSYLNTHIQIHTDKKPYCCDVCNKWFANKSHFNTHIQIHTSRKLYSCDVCNKRLTSKSYLKSHIRIHTGDTPYCCDVCNKRFMYKSHFDTHIQIHTGKKPYCCDVCNKRFTRKPYLKSHIQIHTGDKPYCCDVCNKRFTYKSHFNTHIRIHKGDKPYCCDVCNKRFTNKSHLNTHIQIHTCNVYTT